MKVWESSESIGSLPVYRLTREYSPKWWGTLKMKDGRWRFTFGKRNSSAERYSYEKTGWKNIATAKQRAKVILGTYTFLNDWDIAIKQL